MRAEASKAARGGSEGWAARENRTSGSAESRRGIVGRRARQPGLPSPDPPPRNSGDTNRVPWREVGQIPETPPGVPTGFGFGSVGGDRCQNSQVDSGDRGRAVQLALTI